MLRPKEVNHLSADYQNGVVLHRWIDEYTDTHPVVLSLVKNLSADLGRYAPVATDVYFDFFLALKWDMFTDQPYESYCDQAYQMILAFKSALPARIHPQIEAMVAEKWLHGFLDISTLDFIFKSLHNRATFENNFLAGKAIWESRFFEIEATFMEFFPELAGYVKLRWNELTSNNL